MLTLLPGAVPSVPQWHGHNSARRMLSYWAHAIRVDIPIVYGMQIEQQTEATSERKNGGLLGGYKEVSTGDDEVTEAANFAAEQLSQRSNSLYPFKVKEVRAVPSVHAAVLCASPFMYMLS